MQSLFIHIENYNCSLSVYDLQRTTSTATEIIITSQVGADGGIDFCNGKRNDHSPRWEIFIIMENSFRTGPFLTMNEYSPSPPGQCCSTDTFMRCTAVLKNIDGMTLNGFAFLRIVKPAMTVTISGPKESEKRFGEVVVLKAYLSLDPDTIRKEDLRFRWMCKRKKDKAAFKGECPYGWIAEKGARFYINMYRLQSNHTYFFQLIVSKGNNTCFTVHALKALPAVQFSFR